jgi:hypothetical protein
MNIGPRPAKPGVEVPAPHVIDEYKHRLQQITCTCGWRGSSASPDGRNSEWKDHLAANRPPGASRR